MHIVTIRVLLVVIFKFLDWLTHNASMIGASTRGNSASRATSKMNSGRASILLLAR